MDTFAALALATDAPTEKILDRKPYPKSAPLITINMWKMIIGQAIYQLVVTFVLFFAGPRILGYDTQADPKLESQLRTMVFNTFVWMQIFNEFNNRRLDNKLNIFEGVHRNWFFIGINCVMVAGQVMIIFIGGAAFQIVRIDGGQWAICLLCAVFCLPWAIVLRYIPDHLADTVFSACVRVVQSIIRPIKRIFVVAWTQFKRPGQAFARLLRSKLSKDSSQDRLHMDEESTIESQDPVVSNAAHMTPPPITITSTT